MQLALGPGANGNDAKSGLSTAKTNRLLAAGVALAGAGVIAASPVAPTGPTMQQHDIELTATTIENIQNLIELISANPFPIVTALGEVASYHTQTTQESIAGALQGVVGIWSGMGAAKGLETILPQMLEYIMQGDFSHAYDLLNWDLLFDMQNVFQPLFDHTVRGTGEFVPGMFGLGADLTHAIANVQDMFGDFSFWKSTAKYLTEPLIGFQFALADNMTNTGDHVPQDPIDALLNGYIPWSDDGAEPHGAFWGLLTEQGTVSYLFSVFPEKIADAITLNLPVDADVAPAAFTAVDSLFDADLLTGIFS